ncbi:MAG: M42 family metallopeptidase [Firmicutes bacterium]|nr:M42 family metallopeptidase [Bacillota bacterium]
MESIERFLKDICKAPGVSGYEQHVSQIIKAGICSNADEVRQDRLGNVVFMKKGDGENRPRIMLAAHMDEIGFMVTKIEEGGFLRFSFVGGIDPRTIIGQEVLLYGKETLEGVIGAKPPHLTEATDRATAYATEDLFIDVAMSEERVRKLISVGDIAIIRRDVMNLVGSSLAGKAMDDRAGVAVLLVCLQELERLCHVADVYAVATVQEEVGVRGATTATYGIVPDIGIAVDVTHGEMPGVPEHDTCRLGKGPGITIGPNIHPHVGEKLIRIAKEYNIPYQIETAAGPTGTDARAIQVTRGGIPTGLVSIPLRYMHTSVELLDMEDIKQTGRLLAYFIAAVDTAFVEELPCC